MAEGQFSIGDIAITPDNRQLVWTGQAWAAPNTPQAIQALRQMQGPDPNKLESVGMGMMDMVQGAGQLTGVTSPEAQARFSQDRALFDRNASTSDQLFRGVGQAAMTAPLGGPAALAGRGALATAAATGAAGGATGALMFADDADERIANVATGIIGGAVGGVVVPKLLDVAGRTAGAMIRSGRRLFGSLSPTMRTSIDLKIDDAARAISLSPTEVSGAVRDRIRAEALQMMSQGDDFTADMLARRLRAEQVGFTGNAAPTRGQLSRNPTQFSLEREAAKREGGEALAERFGVQEERTRQILESMKSRPGSADRFDAGQAAETAVNRRAAQLQRGVSQAYDKARASYGDGGELSLEAFRQRTAATLADAEDVVEPAVKRRIAEITDGARPLEPLELEKLDKLLTDTLGPTATPAARRGHSLLKRDLVRVWGDSGYAEAKRLASERFRLLGRRGGVADALRNDKLAPEQVVQRLMSGRVRDVAALKRLIGNEPEWQQLQDATLQKIIARSFKNSSDELSSGRFSPAAFGRIVGEMEDQRLKLLFGADGASKLRNLANAADDLFSLPSGHTVNTSNTGVNIGRAVHRLVQTVMGINPQLQAVIPQGGGQRVSGSVVQRALNPAAGPPPQVLPQRVIDLGAVFGPGVGAIGAAQGASQATGQ